MRRRAGRSSRPADNAVGCPARILVTGGHGFVGSHLLPRLAAAFPSAKITAPNAASLDITQPDRVADAVGRLRPDACIHLAAIAAVPAARRNPELAWTINLRGSLALAEAIRRHVPDCLLLYPSSADAYGRSFRSAVPLAEGAPLSPLNAYGATKAAAEMGLVALAAEGLRLVVLRPFNHTGPAQSAAFAVPAFARQIVRVAAGLQPPTVIVGALDPIRDFLDVRDVCDAYVAAITHADTLATASVFNIASGVPRRIGDVLDALLDLAGVTATIETKQRLAQAGGYSVRARRRDGRTRGARVVAAHPLGDDAGRRARRLAGAHPDAIGRRMTDSRSMRLPRLETLHQRAELRIGWT